MTRVLAFDEGTMAPMRVLLINQVFYPDHAATAQHADDLARHLVRHGHEVDVIASRSIYGTKGAGLPAFEEHEGVRIHRVGRSVFGKAGIDRGNALQRDMCRCQGQSWPPVQRMPPV